MKKKTVYFILASLVLSILFSGCDGINALNTSGGEKIKYKIEDGEATVKELPNKSTVTELTIPDEYEGCPVTVIADFAGVNLENITVITIGKNVKEIGRWAFENNQKLTQFRVSPDNASFCAVDGVLYTKDMKTLLFYPPSRELTISADSDKNEVKQTKYAIPDGVETIRTKAFYKCQLLSEIILPASLTSIEEKAFFRCSALKAVSLPDGLSFIGKDAFGYCTAIGEINIPATVTQIDEYAFFNCTNLLKVNIDNTESAITLGKKWYPTDNGREIDKLEITWKQ